MKFLKFLGKFNSVILSIIFFACITIFIVANFALNIFNGDIIKETLVKIDLETIKATDIISKNELQKYDEEISLEDYLVNTLSENTEIKKDVAREIVNNDDIKNTIGGIISDYINYTVMDGELPQVSKDDVEKILKNENIVEAYGQTFTDEEINQLYKDTNEMLKEFAVDMKSTSDVETNEDFTEIKEIASSIKKRDVYIAMASFILVFYVIIALFNWSPIKPLLYLGIPTLINGLIFGSIKFINLLPLSKMIDGEYQSVIIKLMNVIIDPLFRSGIICVIIGVISIVLTIIFRTKKNNPEEHKNEFKEFTKENTQELEKIDKKKLSNLNLTPNKKETINEEIIEEKEDK